MGAKAAFGGRSTTAQSQYLRIAPDSANILGPQNKHKSGGISPMPWSETYLITIAGLRVKLWLLFVATFIAMPSSGVGRNYMISMVFA